MNEIIFKGISSSTFPNIIIQELPPIIKPRQRTEQYYIDGRSGVKTIDLGYESYPKPAKIGLKNLNNIDAILNWLDGEGDVIFSNEPDKVYEGRIIEQIDISRIGKLFHQSEAVTWLVYPYKYLLNEPAIALANGVNATIINQGFIESLPLIELEATSETSITINNILTCVVNTNYTYYDVSVDSEEEGLVYKTSDDRQKYPGILTGEFPVLIPGNNTIKVSSPGFIKANVKVRSRFI
jgi:phage-related protein